MGHNGDTSGAVVERALVGRRRWPRHGTCVSAGRVAGCPGGNWEIPGGYDVPFRLVMGIWGPTGFLVTGGRRWMPRVGGRSGGGFETAFPRELVEVADCGGKAETAGFMADMPISALIAGILLVVDSSSLYSSR